jgi:hypothetical protein
MAAFTRNQDGHGDSSKSMVADATAFGHGSQNLTNGLLWRCLFRHTQAVSMKLRPRPRPPVHSLGSHAQALRCQADAWRPQEAPPRLPDGQQPLTAASRQHFAAFGRWPFRWPRYRPSRSPKKPTWRMRSGCFEKGAWLPYFKMGRTNDSGDSQPGPRRVPERLIRTAAQRHNRPGDFFLVTDKSHSKPIHVVTAVSK